MACWAQNYAGAALDFDLKLSCASRFLAFALALIPIACTGSQAFNDSRFVCAKARYRLLTPF